MNSTPLPPSSRECVFLFLFLLLILFSIKRIVEFFESFISLFPIERDDVMNMNYARELTIIIITKSNRNINGVSIEGEDITQTLAFQTPGGGHNNGSRVPLHSVVVRDFSFWILNQNSPFFLFCPLSRLSRLLLFLQSHNKKPTDWLPAVIYETYLCFKFTRTHIYTHRTNRRRC